MESVPIVDATRGRVYIRYKEMGVGGGGGGGDLPTPDAILSCCNCNTIGLDDFSKPGLLFVEGKVTCPCPQLMKLKTICSRLTTVCLVNRCTAILNQHTCIIEGPWLFMFCTVANPVVLFVNPFM